MKVPGAILATGLAILSLAGCGSEARAASEAGRPSVRPCAD